jgi:aspartate aminotransferase-like enzyme
MKAGGSGMATSQDVCSSGDRVGARERQHVTDRTFDVYQDTPSKLVARNGRTIFKIADGETIFRQIHRLNHSVFVRELGQHISPRDQLVDKFHHKNTYLVAMRRGRLVGMLAVHGAKPFSISERLPDPNALKALSRPLEVRLLAIRSARRGGLILAGLLALLWRYAQAGAYTHLLVSGLEQRRALYQRLGLQAIGPAVQSGKASFIPMLMDLTNPAPTVLMLAARLTTSMKWVKQRPLRLLPGPVHLAKAVRESMARHPMYHRSNEFARLFEKTRAALCDLTKGAQTVLLCGSGTLANDAVALALAAESRARKGLVLVNGEFGERLVDQAQRAGLQFRTLEWPWGVPWDLGDVARALAGDPDLRWVWGVHLETSTGVLNDLAGLSSLARSQDIDVCVDCVSSLGAVSADLSCVHLAAASSGKSLGGVAGVAMVIVGAESVRRVMRLQMPSYIDLAAAIQTRGPRFTMPSCLLSALDFALNEYLSQEARERRFQNYAELGRLVRAGLRDLGIDALAAEACAAPVITTFKVPAWTSPTQFAKMCRQAGYEVAYQSQYLRKRRLAQIATMGAIVPADLTRLFDGINWWAKGCKSLDPCS